MEQHGRTRAVGLAIFRGLPDDPRPRHLLADDFVLPNGLAFSPDESVLYINDTRRGHIRAFELLPSGMLAKHTDRVFADLRGPEPGVPELYLANHRARQSTLLAGN